MVYVPLFGPRAMRLGFGLRLPPGRSLLKGPVEPYVDILGIDVSRTISC